ncbi:hypothetical protein VIN7_6994 [Saccharomyces cerevisiae x Saccharomyces kudriavzevii VIN7]|uniref:Uncharacterized protein n=1 Tax=Saccharomyces cerevisiae x Saccharomyces kudriavzevii (strain VIN7) TaxID=1095631 RepID=H0GUJ6_SACCK|nr:hypothetical protein VIN7_6994 [Saccharomyces cerevisiae x Saccharomyces kudriavzevii VIN7]
MSHRNNTLDVQKFLQCLGGNSFTSISLYASTPNNFILANSNSITDEEVGPWLRCLREQEVDAELSLDTGVLRMDDEELVASSDTHGTFPWISTTFMVADANFLAKRADTGIQYSVFPNNNINMSTNKHIVNDQ